MEIKDYQIADLLRVAKDRLAYCAVISNYPQKVGKKNFDTSSKADIFYKNICNTCFNDALLIIGSLLGTDSRVMSLWNWKEFAIKKSKELQDLGVRFVHDGLKEVRDQIIAHQDTDNSNNRFPSSRRQGTINPILIKRAQDLLENMISEFDNYTRSIGNPHSPSYFDDSGAIEEIEFIMTNAQPTLTDSDVI